MESTGSQAPAPSRLEATRTAWAIAPGVFLAGVGGGIVFPILPVVGLADHLPPLLIGLILAANRLTRVATNSWVGAWVDRLGGKRLLAAGLAAEVGIMGIYWLASVNPHPGVLFLCGRLMWGPASGAIFISGQTLALNAGGRQWRGLTAGLVRSAQSLGAPAGMVFGGVVAGTLGEPAAFLVGMVAAAVATGVALARVPDLRVVGARPPGRWRELWASLRDGRVAALAGINFAGFLAVQGVLLATMALLVVQRRLHLWTVPTEAMSGVLLAVVLATAALTAPWSGRLADRLGARSPVAAAGLLTLVPGFALLGAAHRALPLVAALVLVGVGMGLFNVPLLALLGDVIPPAARGAAVGIFQLFGDAGGSLGPLFGSALFAVLGPTALYWTVALWLALWLPVVGWLVAAERRRPSPPTNG